MNIKKSIRIIFRNKIYSQLNIAGLAIGIAAAALIFLWVEDKVDFNKAIQNSRNLYVAGQHFMSLSGEYSTFLYANNMLSEVLANEYPEVKSSTRYTKTSMVFVPENRTDAFDENGIFADSTLFTMIGMEFLRGNPSAVFEPARPVIISQSMAEKLFGTEDPIGKGLISGNEQYEITGVFKDMPDNTTFRFEWIIPFRIMVERSEKVISVDNWGTIWLQVYAELEPNVDVGRLNEKLKTLAGEKGGEGHETTRIFLYPLNKTLLYGEFKEGKETGGGYIKTVRLFFLIGVLILIIACINFMNLSTARSQKRALEVGVRKTFGTKRKYLIRQFMVESGLITIISLLLAIGLIWLSLPMFNKLIDTQLTIDPGNPTIWTGLLAIGLFCTLLAGSYPALYLSSFNPVTTLKMQKVTKKGTAVWIRQGLVVFQFTMAFILISTTFVVYLQIRLVQKRDIGIEMGNLVTFPVTKEVVTSHTAVLNELKNTGVVESSGLSNQMLINMGTQTDASAWNWNGKDPNEDVIILYNLASEGLIDAAGIKLIDGTDFDPVKNGKDVLINEAMAQRMGKEGRVGGKLWQRQDQQLEVAGIIKNYISNDLYAIDTPPAIFLYNPEAANLLFVRLKENVEMFDAIGRIQPVLQTFTPHHAFEPTLMIDHFHHMFKDESLIEKLSALFAALAIFISCLGLLGLSAFSAEQRTKEIGVRKVLGARITNILAMLGKSYLMLLLVSFIIGIPVSLYVTYYYLKDYAYRIVLSWDIFVGVAFFIALIALATVGFQSLKAAIANPVDSMKTE